MTTGQTQAVPLDGGIYPGGERRGEERKRRTRRLVAPRRAPRRARRRRVLPGPLAGRRLERRRARRRGPAPGRRDPAPFRTTGSTSARSPPGRTPMPRAPSCRATRLRETSVAKSSTVDLLVSAGPNVPIVTVPPVKGDPLAQAIQALNAVGLTYTVHNVPGGNQPEGTVLGQSPGGREQGQADDEGGPHRVGQPDLGVGTERRRSDADGGRRHLEPGAPQRGGPDGRLLRPVRRRAGLGPEPRRRDQTVPAEHRRLGRDLHRALCRPCPAWSGRLRLGPAGHRGGRSRRQHPFDTACPGGASRAP